MVQYTAKDLLECTLALFLFLPLTFVPGYVAAYALNLAGFRAFSRAERLPWSVVLSFGTSTLPFVFVSSVLSLRAAALCFYLLAAVGLAILTLPPRLGGLPFRIQLPQDRATRFTLLLCAFWCIALPLQLVDIQWGHQLFASITVRDHCYRTAFIESVLRTGVPPTNPLYYTGHPALMRNYYFLYVFCAVVSQATGIAARYTLIASCAWSALGMFSAAALFCKYFLPPLAELRRTVLLSTFLFAVTGLDILVVIWLHFTPIHRFDADMEWWDPDHYPSWLDSFLYVPHHVASLVCCLAALLLLWVTRAGSARRWTTVLVAATCFASAFGLSIYVAFAFALSVAMWALSLVNRRQRTLLTNMVLAAAVSGALIAPVVRQLRSETAATGTGTAFPLKLQLRQLYGLNEWYSSLASAWSPAQSFPKIFRTLLWALLALPITGLELGLFGFCGVVILLRRRRGWFETHEGLRALIILTGASLFSTIAIRSSVTTINDYGMRTAMLPLFLLLVLTAGLLASTLRLAPPRRTRVFHLTLGVFLALGVFGTVYQAIGVRIFLPLYQAGRLRDHRTNAAFPGMSQEVYQLRTSYAALDRIVPPNAVVQYNPASIGSYFLYLNMLYVDHQVVSAEPGCGKSFGGDARACPGIEKDLAILYAGADATIAQAICHNRGIQYLLVTDQDPAWQDSMSWVWEWPVIVRQPRLAILACP